MEWELEEYVSAIAGCLVLVRCCTGQRPHLLGHSLGGTLAMLCVARHPDVPVSLMLAPGGRFALANWRQLHTGVDRQAQQEAVAGKGVPA
ncbi:alpha/beta fold hydrolase [Azohydromonas lata]|uniref:Alpha/beta fold hydrolase n=1 Tax=Azohydromonas lata TaxID=45677 RepID=A0ABU5IA48_9BURK|nr:alpha/beta fold hydrolase [Azohydromonas lata]MDZ5455843.1 alpha/beta fold hydrolase [Azohydromonas lata]